MIITHTQNTHLEAKKVHRKANKKRKEWRNQQNRPIRKGSSTPGTRRCQLGAQSSKQEKEAVAPGTRRCQIGARKSRQEKEAVAHLAQDGVKLERRKANKKRKQIAEPTESTPSGTRQCQLGVQKSKGKQHQKQTELHELEQDGVSLQHREQTRNLIEQISKTQDEPQWIVAQGYSQHLQYLDSNKSSTKDLSLPLFEKVLSHEAFSSRSD